ncbi:AzlC family ABC transporter permease [Streptomyces sp. NEAU-Y11]|uniref:AzlC family ABC transporter permease n=1 Tax=Streptomyces cucumeris TaxID=2962890 RepID=UPI0020C8A904|nr:AzlC family ABC transporter permease [Streptomyces sp. NEAU-Y11]MCP9210338.1 AzlC family ABC transporter permease [Streptomyces sp. NEAU-Y11]
MRSLYRTYDPRLLRDVAMVCLADGVIGASFGAITVAGGLPAWLPVVMSLVVFAGAAQFSAVGVLLAGGSPLAAAATGLLLNTRTVPFSLALTDSLGSGRAARMLGAHLITDETAAFALAEDDPARRRTTFRLSGLTLFITWNLGVLAGSLVGTALGDPGALGLDAAYPAVLLALTVPALRDPRTRRAVLTGAALALAATPFLPPGLPVLLALAGVLTAGRPS